MSKDTVTVVATTEERIEFVKARIREYRRAAFTIRQQIESGFYDEENSAEPRILAEQAEVAAEYHYRTLQVLFPDRFDRGAASEAI